MIDEELLFFMKVCGLVSRVVMLLLILLCFLNNPFVSFHFPYVIDLRLFSRVIVFVHVHDCS